MGKKDKGVVYRSQDGFAHSTRIGGIHGNIAARAVVGESECTDSEVVEKADKEDKEKD